MNETLMRTEVKAAYGNNPSWKSKVDKMSAKQVQAVYFRLKNKGTIR